MIGQPVVERIMTERLKELNTSVHYSENVCGIEESDESVSVTTDLGRKIHAKYALAADGARSTIRNALGISFTGTKPEMLWAVLDTFIETDFPVSPEIVTFELNGQARVSWIPRERGMARFYVLLEGEVTQERAENSIREHLAPHKVDFKKTEWFSTFDGKLSKPLAHCINSKANEDASNSQREDRRHLRHKGRSRAHLACGRRRTRAFGQRRPRAEYRHCRFVRTKLASSDGCQEQGVDP